MLMSDTRTDSRLRAAVEEEIEWMPGHSERIGVAVTDGTVELAGEVASYTERLEVIAAAFRVDGVRAVVDTLAIHDRGQDSPIQSDVDIARAVQSALTWASGIGASVHAEVRLRHVILTGVMRTRAERENLRRLVTRIRGVAGVDDLIHVTTGTTDEALAAGVRRALQGQGFDPTLVHAGVEAGIVTLLGRVDSLAERDEATQVARDVPGVLEVRCRLAVL